MTDTEKYGFEQTLMYGQFTTTRLQKYAKDQAARLRKEAKERKEAKDDEDDNDLKSYQDSRLGSIKRFIDRMKPCWIHLGSDWVFLFLLGLIMALISFVLDLAIDKCQTAHIWLYGLSSNVVVQYFVWVIFPLILVTFSVGFTHLVSPHAIGSGIPEMKVILRGTVLSRYLSLKTLIAKIIGLLTALGSGIPIGKEGPFVHIASMVARSMGKFVGSFKGIFTNESRNTEMLAAACAVGVSSCFGSPIGGVLFSIEVTATYFAVRNYWRGFYAAVCGAFVFRLLAVFYNAEETITALFKTNFRVDFPFDVEEFVAFASIGVACGFGGALFVYTHRKIVNLIRHHRKTKIAKFLQSNRFIYPALVTFVVATITFPQGLGQFMAGQLTQKQALDELFSNTTWSATKPKDAADIEVLKHWDGANTNIYVTLVIFIVLKFLMTSVAVALPIPAGVFFPVFLIGAAFGRLVGEAMATWFPNGIRDGDIVSPVVPGGYAVVGAAAMSGAVTHTISTSVIVFELTGQIVHILPVMVAVLIANAIAQWLQPSFYDSIIQIKSLPYLPDLTNLGVYNIMVADIMKTNLFYITYQSTYAELKHLLEASDHRSYPLVDAPDSMILLGSIQRPQLISLLNQHLNKSLQVSSRAESEDALCRPDSPDSSTSLVNEESRKESPAVLEVEAQVSLPKRESNNKQNRSSILEKIPVPQRLHKLFGSGTNMSDIERASDNRDIDTQTAEQQAQWEREILQMPIDFNNCKIDPAPFQLVERTSLLKVHKLFALLNLSHAYVTTLGRLAGLVSLKEVRQAIEGEKYVDATDVNTSSPDPLEFNDFSPRATNDVMLESKPSRSSNTVPHEESPKL